MILCNFSFMSLEIFKAYVTIKMHVIVLKMLDCNSIVTHMTSVFMTCSMFYEFLICT